MCYLPQFPGFMVWYCLFTLLLLRDLDSIQLLWTLLDLELEMMGELGPRPFEEAVLSVDRRRGSASPGETGADDLDYRLPETMVSMVLFRCPGIIDAHFVNRSSWTSEHWLPNRSSRWFDQGPNGWYNLIILGNWQGRISSHDHSVNRLWILRCDSTRCHWQDLLELKKPRHNMGRRRNWPNPSSWLYLYLSSYAWKAHASASRTWRAELSAAAWTISNSSAVLDHLLESESLHLFLWWHFEGQSSQHPPNSARHPLLDSEIYASALSPPGHYRAQRFHKPQANPSAVVFGPLSRFQRYHHNSHFQFCGCCCGSTMGLAAATCFTIQIIKNFKYIFCKQFKSYF